MVDHQAYAGSSPRLLFLLKEANDREGGLRDLCQEVIARADRKQTWENVARWTLGLRNLSRDLQWSEIEDLSADVRRTALLSIAAMNLKKSPGGYTTDPDAFATAVRTHAVRIARQFHIYEPDVAICCGSLVAWGIKIALDKSLLEQWSQTRRGIPYVEYAPGRFIVSYVHPEARVADSLKYYGLVDACRELLT
ncbi:MAG TPA: hypothetical protein VNN55_12140 [bacterium]|nr:hypothetical protein [bacterium]